MNLSITYTSEKPTKFKAGFLRACPVPLDDDDQPTMTEDEWIKKWGKEQFLNQYRRGVQLLKRDEVVYESDIIV